MRHPAVRFSIDEQDLLSWEELVGDFWLSGDRGEIHERATYIDSWLVALSEGLKGLHTRDAVAVEIPEERDDLRLEWSEGELVVSYGQLTTVFSSISDLETSLVEAAQRLVSRAGKLNLARTGVNVEVIEQLANSDCGD